MKILFVLPRMITGGLERVTLQLISALQERGHQCTLALRRSYGDFLPEAQKLCPVHEIAGDGLHHFVPNLAKMIRSLQPTHVVTALSDIGLLAYLAIRLSGVPVFWAHGVHGTHDLITANPGLIGRIRFNLDQIFASWVYRRCNIIIAVSNGVRDDIIKKFKASNVVTIYNPILDAEKLIPRPKKILSKNNVPKLVALGRLSRQKGFDILIEAMTKIPQPWDLEIWGDGEEKSTLQELIKSRNLQNKITLCGNTSKPFEILRKADLFILSSRYEGLPTVIIEALSSQCNIVATDCPHGPREILDSGRFGILVENENSDALAKGIMQSLSNKNPATAEEILERAKSFSIEISVNQWELAINPQE